jgi:nitroreductase
MIPFEKNRSYRRFFQNQTIPEDHLLSMIDAARLSPSSRNLQPIKFFYTNRSKVSEKIFPALGWAGYLKDWDGPAEGERPSAYIILLHDKAIAPGYSCDNGIFAQSILLRAVELGWGGCMIASVKKELLKKELDIPRELDPILVIALGKPAEKVVVEEAENGEIKYWRDNQGVHHVPKRRLDQLIWNPEKNINSR